MSEQIEGRNAVLEAFRSGKCVDKLFILDGCQDGPVRTIAREARKKDTIINYVAKERLDQLSETGAHQGVIGNEGEGVSRLIREKCDFVASIPMKGDIDSLNASVAAGVLGYEIVRQRLQKK